MESLEPTCCGCADLATMYKDDNGRIALLGKPFCTLYKRELETESWGPPNDQKVVANKIFQCMVDENFTQKEQIC